MILVFGCDTRQHFDDNKIVALAMPFIPIRVFLCHPHMLIGGNDYIITRPCNEKLLKNQSTTQGFRK
jgi:hypothetical protein